MIPTVVAAAYAMRMQRRHHVQAQGFGSADFSCDVGNSGRISFSGTFPDKMKMTLITGTSAWTARSRGMY